MAETAKSLLTFWNDEVTAARWYKPDAALDVLIRERFLASWNTALTTQAPVWEASLLASIILCDQLSRNMHRDQAEAFATDPLARRCVREALANGDDLRTPDPLRQFWYMPLCHSEDLGDQDDAVALIADRLEGHDTLLHAYAHREVIQRFGRFPFRNAALGRTNTTAEVAFFEGGGYGSVVSALRAEGAANPQPSGGRRQDSLMLS